MAKKINKNKTISVNRPVGVTILGVLHYIAAVFLLIAGLALLFGASLVVVALARTFPVFAILANTGVILLAILSLVFAVLLFSLAKGLMKGRNWARIVVLVFSAISLLGSLSAPLLNLVNIIIDGLIIWYLGFNKEAISYFK